MFRVGEFVQKLHDLVVIEFQMSAFLQSLPGENFFVHPLVLLGTRLEGDARMDFCVGGVLGIALGSAFYLPQNYVSLVGLEDELDVEIETGFVVEIHGGPIRGGGNDGAVKILVAVSTLKGTTGNDGDHNPGPFGSVRQDDGFTYIELGREDELKRWGVDIFMRCHVIGSAMDSFKMSYDRQLERYMFRFF